VKRNIPNALAGEKNFGHPFRNQIIVKYMKGKTWTNAFLLFNGSTKWQPCDKFLAY
jgi:hypothetical protein